MDDDIIRPARAIVIGLGIVDLDCANILLIGGSRHFDDTDIDSHASPVWVVA